MALTDEHALHQTRPFRVGLTAKLVLSYLLIGLTVVVLSAFALQRQLDSSTTLVGDSPMLNDALRLNSLANHAFQEGFAYVASGDVGERGLFQRKLDELERNVSAFRMRMKADGDSRLQLIDAMLRALDAAKKQSVVLFAEFESTGATKLSFPKYEEAIDDVVAATEALVDYETRARSESRDRAFRSAVTHRLLVRAGIAVVLLSVAIGVVFGRNIGQRIRRLRDATNAIADGRHETAISFEASDDEIGQLASSFSHMTRKIRTLVARVEGQSAQMRDTLRSMREMLVLVSPEHRIMLANPAACVTLGYTENELLGLAFSDICPDLDVPGSAGSAWEGEHERTFRAKDGRSIPVRVSGSRLDDATNGESHVFVAQDLTEHREMRARLMVADRLVSLGTLAGGITHEINNPLTYLLTNLELLESEVGSRAVAPAAERAAPADIDAMVGEALVGATRIRDIVRDLKTFSRADDQKRGPVDVGTVVESCIKMAGNEIRHRARLVKDIQPVSRADANESRIGQVVLNLLINAAHAIKEGRAEANEIRVATRMEGGFVVIEVQDTGSGMSPEVCSRIFDPFFTTKKMGEGTGLGLAICHGIVNGLGGEITVESVVGKGSTFVVRLPAIAAVAVAEPTAGHTRQPRKGNILLIDDDPLVAKVIRRMLAKEHEVTVADGGAAGLALLQKNTAYDVILCDLMMPSVTGKDIYEHMAKERPSDVGRLTFMTGGVFTEGGGDFVDHIANTVLQKPIEAKVLRALIRERVDA